MAYGAGAAGMSENFGFSLDAAKMILDRVLGAYTGLASYRERAPAAARAKGYIAIRPCRRVLYVEGVSTGTQAINAPIQGGAASASRSIAMRMVDDALRARPDLDSRLATQIHDEFLLDAPAGGRAAEAGAIMVDCMVMALLTIYPEAEDQGVHRLTAALVCDRWSDKT